MNEMLQSRLKARLDETGRNAREVSLKVSNSPDTVRNILRGATRDPKAAVLDGIATELLTSSDWLLGKTDDVNVVAKELRPADVAPPLRSTMPSDIPVYGTAAGSHLRGAFQLEQTVVDYVRRPPGLQGAKDAYALYVEGSSMEPRFWPGDLVFIHPHRPAKIGDAVVVQTAVSQHEIEASLGHLNKRTGEHIVLGKLNPAAEVHLKREHVIAVHKVLTTNEMFGL